LDRPCERCGWGCRPSSRGIVGSRRWVVSGRPVVSPRVRRVWSQKKGRREIPKWQQKGAPGQTTRQPAGEHGPYTKIVEVGGGGARNLNQRPRDQRPRRDGGGQESINGKHKNAEGERSGGTRADAAAGATTPERGGKKAAGLDSLGGGYCGFKKNPVGLDLRTTLGQKVKQLA